MVGDIKREAKGLSKVFWLLFFCKSLVYCFSCRLSLLFFFSFRIMRTIIPIVSTKPSKTNTLVSQKDGKYQSKISNTIPIPPKISKALLHESNGFKNTLEGFISYSTNFFLLFLDPEYFKCHIQSVYQSSDLISHWANKRFYLY
ncbi:hypothetical protein IWT30_01885 [Secundilactobacillus mixtipabuli]|uniref:Uncharacterized protein n=1 Tax=Secundilactobacillus mixtipabuli TaxID=1435342 RepID=A0A1Z5IDZ7_9LACO|nr:hypothetical protein IWT30_01885 [Secundilactobacillus mixtipabuli]